MDFTKLLNRGHRRYIDKYLRPRKFGQCEGCSTYELLTSYIDSNETDYSWKLCNRCYDKMIENG